MIRRLALSAALLAGVLSLAACESSEERAQKYYEKALALIEEGDPVRAQVELRNVFKLDGSHRDARATYARLEEERGNPAGAYSQYLRLIEQYPEDVEGQRAATRLAAELGDWEAAGRHAEAAAALSPDDPMIAAVQVGVDYREALRVADLQAQKAAVDRARALMEADPEFDIPRKVVINDLMRREDWQQALEVVEAGLVQEPDNMEYHGLRLGALEQLGRDPEIEAQLKDMVTRFPENERVQRALIAWYTARGERDAAETYLRGRIDPASADPARRLELVAFINQTDPQAAQAELDSILAEPGLSDENRALYRSVRAEIDFQTGARDKAIAEMEAVLETAAASEQTNRIKVTLSRMLLATGNAVGARALVEEVLAADPTQVDALKLKAAWLIEDDRTGDALVELRQALDQSPRDPEIMTLMARAHERAGSQDLVGEMLSLAVEASDAAPEETLRYANFLIADDKLPAAEEVMLDALRRQPANVPLLGGLGALYIRMQDWPRAQGTIDALARDGSDLAQAASTELTARLLAAQNRRDELENLLSGLAGTEAGGLQAVASVIQLRLDAGDVAGALDYVRAQLEETPDDPTLKFIEATVLALDGQTDEAARIYRDILTALPREERVWVALYNLHASQGETDRAAAVLDEALAALPDSGTLNWIRAGVLERQGDVDGAIAVYEKLYSANSNSVVLANNLASLISSYRDDEASLQRAYEIARRLRGTDQAPFQDTYGWITFRMGNAEEAAAYLEPAAAALAGDPTVQYHLARTYAALGRDDAALEQYRKVVELAQASPRALPFMSEVESEIARLEQAARQPADQPAGQSAGQPADQPADQPDPAAPRN